MDNKNYKQIVILSGKGGTGKTTVSSALIDLIKNKIVMDCDVDAANLYLILDHEKKDETDFSGGYKAVIDETKCMGCGRCASVCSFGAIKDYKVDTVMCEGCGFCYEVCKRSAISLEPFITGTYYKCELKDGSPFFYAKLKPGEGNSGKLVSEIKKKALEEVNEKTKWVVVDGPPGIGCPVNASLAGADFVVIVTESSKSGFHDFKRLAELLQKMYIRFGIVINKYDLSEKMTNEIISFSFENNFPVLGKIPFDPSFPKAIQQRKTILEFLPEAKVKENLVNIWDKISEQFSRQDTIVNNEVEK